MSHMMTRNCVGVKLRAKSRERQTRSAAGGHPKLMPAGLLPARRRRRQLRFVTLAAARYQFYSMPAQSVRSDEAGAWLLRLAGQNHPPPRHIVNG
jgi:hypothetical protein